MHWADVVAEKLLEDSNDHVISSGITPSGPIHLGSMREILTADAVARAVNDKGGNAKLIYIADNADPLRKVYPFLDPNIYEKYVGLKQSVKLTLTTYRTHGKKLQEIVTKAWGKQGVEKEINKLKEKHGVISSKRIDDVNTEETEIFNVSDPEEEETIINLQNENK